MAKAKPKAKRQYNPRRNVKPAKAVETPPVVTAHRPVGRPSEYGPHVLEITKAYFESGYKERGQQIPTKAGLGIILGHSQDTLNRWGKEYHEFSEALRMGLNYTELELLDGGLTGRFNPTFTGLVAANTIGYRSAKSEIDHKSSDGSMSPTKIVIQAG